MGTTLQAMGLPPGVCADTWVREHPERIQAVHEAFVAVGAGILRTATLCTRPERTPDLLGQARAAVALARAAHPGAVWLSVGPGGPARGPAVDLQPLARAGADAVLLETFVDGAEAIEAAEALIATGVPVAVSLVPRPDGLLFDGSEPPLEALLDRGAFAVGFNCGAAPGDVVAAIDRLPVGGPWIAAPVDGPDLPDALAHLAPRVGWLGACCGTDPIRLEAAWPR